jgi:hypothetical protein
MTTIEDIKNECREIIKLGEDTTGGPWEHTVKCYIQSGKEVVADCHWTQKGEMRQNANFIASSRSFTPRAAKALLATIDALEDVASSDGDPHVDESAEYWAKEASSGKAKAALETIRRTWEESK